MHKKLFNFIGLGTIIAAITYMLVSQGLLIGQQKSIQNIYYDLDSASDQIVIVAIDEKSLKEENLGPLTGWTRANYADAIKKLNIAGASAIGIDITFPDSSPHGIGDDQTFANTIKTYDNVVLAARYYFENGERKSDFPNDTLLSVNPDLGWINVQLDSDGFVRMIPIFAPTKTDFVEAFSLALARKHMDAPPDNYRVVNNEFNFSERTVIPTITVRDSDTNQEVYLMYVNYFAQPYKYQHISFSDVLAEDFSDGRGNAIDLENRIVIIGPTAIDLQDDYLSPVSEGIRMPGAEIHANSVQTLITKEFLRDQSRLSLWLMLAGILVVNMFLFAVLKVRYAVPLFILEVFGIMVAGIMLYEEKRIFLNVVYPWFVMFTTFVGSYLLRFILEQKERKFIEGAFGHYVNKDVVKQIIKDPNMLELGGSKKEITVFFSDIEGFTTLSEKMEPVELVGFLNEYLKEMTEIILTHEGTLDKYEGDAVMAFWGAPIPQKDHAIKACTAALDNQKKLAELREEWKKEGKPEVHVRIGINTGEAVVGNMGSENRFDYTAMGDNVNLGSRLEGINKQYGTNLIISEQTYEIVKDEFVCRELDLIRVKGKSHPVRIFELVAKKGEVTDDIKKRNAQFESALKDYRSKAFLAARDKFKEIKDDKASEVYAERCDAFMKNPPEEGWDGVWTFTTK